ncbi:hypothetical protein [Tumebacillus flagellatus]|uniref:Uncharacterized protein n=1 Tax=Tumebacillus flagellatus TaxID=1157490 RepID=A0A074LP33_9BACL|nr:hypothetical protein [Tumebacillus flagellatus]KEO82864.1 hypothetical protein EL26_13225 [Tumebacillus flagellatus]
MSSKKLGQELKIITDGELEQLRERLKPLIGVQFDILSIPEQILIGFEPSQVGTLVGTLMDACIPMLPQIPTTRGALPDVGLKKHEGIQGEREGYPDYIHTSDKRLELKLLFVDNPEIQMKKPPTPREPSARLTQKVTKKNVIPDRDVLLVIAYNLQKNITRKGMYTPTIVDLGLFSVYECIEARDKRMEESGGKWFGNYETPTILSKGGKKKRKEGIELNDSAYGRKKSENRDYNEDTNFGKLNRIPYKPLQAFLKKHKINTKK